MTETPNVRAKPASRNLTTSTLAPNNFREIVRYPWRGLIGLLVIPALALFSVVAPEHLHEADTDHPHPLVHSHLTPHSHHEEEAEAAHSHHDDEGDAPVVAESEGHVLWLDLVSVQHHLFSISGLSATVMARASGSLPLEPSQTILRQFDLIPPHGPPRPQASLRAPPSCHSNLT